jgi:Holliday junction resolvase RusA-like endonuclease
MDVGIHFEVPGPVVAKARARVFTQKAKSGATFTRAYTPKKTVNYENLIKMAFQAARPDGFTPMTGPVMMSIRVYVPIPASFSQKKREMARNNQILPTTKPDWDNYGKIFSDALNGLAYVDDKQVVSGLVRKRYGDSPCADVAIAGAFLSE